MSTDKTQLQVLVKDGVDDLTRVTHTQHHTNLGELLLEASQQSRQQTLARTRAGADAQCAAQPAAERNHLLLGFFVQAQDLGSIVIYHLSCLSGHNGHPFAIQQFGGVNFLQRLNLQAHRGLADSRAPRRRAKSSCGQQLYRK